MAETGLEIAVIGMSGRFPGARDLDEFWENLKNGVESVCFFSENELEDAGIDAEQIDNPNYVKSGGGILEGIEYFDATFFGYTPNEAVVMHPQVRIFHECAWEALESAGYAPGTFKGKIGLYAGASPSTRWESLVSLSGKDVEVGRYAAGSLANKDFLSTRVAYKLGLRGPSFGVQTACSTSLVAVDLACRGILTGLCDMAVAGGVSISGLKSAAYPRGYIYRDGLIRSPDGHCRAFDAKANGIADGEGVGAVVLKLLEDALADGDTVHAVIKGAAVNNDGNRKVGFTAPSVEGQAEVIRAALLVAEVETESITYIETHGTGTALGDPIEMEALKQGFNTPGKGFCRIGSVKTNIGHLDAAAGIAGFIKTVLALEHRQIPPSLHFETPNPAIDFENNPFRVNTALTAWENGKYPLRAGISSFGIGGTNAHVILEGAAPPPLKGPSGHSSSVERKYHLLVLSAKTEPALEKMTVNLVDYLKNKFLNPGNRANPENPGSDLCSIAYTLQVGREAFRHRKMLVCSTVDEAVDALSTPDPERVLSYPAREKSPLVVFMFPGQGSQYVDMGRELYRYEKTFREEMDRCFKILAPLLGVDPKEILYPAATGGGDPGKINRTEFAQPLIFAVEYALAALLMKWGIRPHAMIGHSIGEYVAAHLSGVFSLEDTLKIVALRGKLMQQLPAGAMLGVSVSPGMLEPLLASYPSLSLAAVNSPVNCTVSGPGDAIEDFERLMEKKGFRYRKLHTSHAFHSAMMDPVLKTFEEELRLITPGKPTIPYLSNVTGKWITPADIANPAYWATHLRHTVRFSDGIEELAKKGDSIFLEAGPGRVLTTFSNKTAEAPGHLALNLLRHPGEDVSDLYVLYREIGRMWLFGRETDWRVFHKEGEKHRIPLPTYPFERQSFRLDEGGTGIERTGPLKHGKPAIPGGRPPLSHWFYLPAWKRDIPMRGSVPAAGEEDKTENWLVFLDSCGLGNLLVSRLRALDQPVETVSPGTEFAVPGPGRTSYTLNPRKPGDYRQLFRHLESQNKVPQRILHLWSLTGPHTLPAIGEQVSREQFEQAQYPGFYSLLDIAKAVGKTDTGLSRSLRVDVIADYLFDVTGHEDLVPAKSTMKGALAVIPQEHPGIRCRGIDVLLPDARDSQNPQWERLVTQLSEELLSDRETVDTAAAFRGPHRLVQVFEPFPLETAESLPLVEKGVYLVTGGLGKIGLTLARFLARDYAARLVLIDRVDPHGEKETKEIEELQVLGAEVLVFGADVGDEEQMRAVVEEVERQWDTVNGVLHIAGTVRGRSFDLVDSLDPAACREQFQAKVYGTLALEKLFREKPLDFCWFMSSVSAVLGGLRFSAYAAANACMDALVSQIKRRGGAGGNWIGVDWDGLSPHNTVEAFKRILSLPLHHVDRVVVSSGGNLQERIDRWIRLETLQEKPNTAPEKTAARHPRPQLFNPYVPPSTKTQQSLADTWQRLFGFEKVGITDDFFQLGGDSLKAVTVISTIHKTLTVEIPLPAFFSHPTIKKLAEYIDSIGTGSYSGIPPAEKKEYYSLSPAQMRLFILQQMDPGSTAYNEMQWTVFEDSVDPAAIRDIFERLIRRHDIYRTSITFVEGEPVQRVYPHVDFELQFSDVSIAGEDAGENTGRTIAAFRKPFDTAKPPLLRALLVKTGDRRHVLVIDQHHLVTDGISHLIFMKEIAALYEGKELPPLRLQYKDYAEWVNGPQQRSALQKQETYWLDQFRDEIPLLRLPLDYPRPAVRSFEGRTAGFSLTEGETRGLYSLATRVDATLYMVLLSILNVLLAKLSGRDDIVLGTVVAGRRHEDLRDIIGMFVNTLALRNRPSGERTFAAFLNEVKTNTLDAFENQEYPFELLVEKVDIAKDTGRNPLFDVMFALQTQAEKDTGGAAPETWKPVVDRVRAVKFDLTLEGIESDNRLNFKMQYCTRLFHAETVTRFIAYFKNIVAGVLDKPSAAICDIDILPAEEKQRLLYDLNDTAASYPSGMTIHELFREQVLRTPDAVALHMPHGTHPSHLTYNELDRRTGQLAGLLREKGVGPDVIVGIRMERSPGMIVGLMGILKAGGAYLPIDTGYPEDRVRYMLKDSGARILLKSETNSNDQNPNDQNPNDQNKTGTPLVLNFEHLNVESVLNFDIRVSDSSSSNLAYVIYTSGSTGKPRGVLTMHYNVTRVVKETNYITITEKDRVLQLSNYAFDGSVFDIYGALLNGAALVMAGGGDTMDVGRLAALIEKERVSVFFVTTSLFNLMVDREPRIFNTIRKVVFGGERASFEHTRRALAHAGPGKLINGYGPTETTVFAAFYPVDTVPAQPDTIPIGVPLSNTRIYIMDNYLNPVPTGVTGEIYIGGDGTSRGYLNRPELTSERFSRGAAPSHILYRTGDLAFYRPDPSGRGTYHIVYQGRTDHQVKIRGFRIELGEIENQLLKQDGVDRAVVLAREDKTGDRYLCAYILTREELDIHALKTGLSGMLPPYMIPSYFIPLAKIPLTPNGKLDTRALPEPSPERTGSYTPPGNETEARLARIWSEVLGIDITAVGVDSNFFDLGGHSLRATVVVSQIHKEFNVKMPLVQIFRTPTIRELAACIRGNFKVEYASVQPAEKKEYYPLSPAQKRMYILQQLEASSVNYNMPQFIPIAPSTDLPRLESAFRQIIARHESLRTSFIMVEGEPVQRVHDEMEFKLENHDGDMGGEMGGEIASPGRGIYPFDLSIPPLLRAGILAAGDGRHFLIVDTHHIISDGISQTILMEEFQVLYDGGELSPLPLQYRDYAQWLTAEEQQEAIRFQEEYWLREFSGEIPVLTLPLDYSRPAVQSFKGRALYFSLTPAETAGLNAVASREEATLYMVLSAAVNILLSKLSGREDIVIGAAAAGRRHADLERIIGMFVNTLPLRNFPSGTLSFTSFLKTVKERTLASFENQDYPFENLVEKVDVAKDAGRNPLFDVMFTLQNIVDKKSKGPGPVPGNREKPIYEDRVAKFDLTITGIEAGDCLKFGFQYSTRLFKEETVQRFIVYFKKIVTSVLTDTERAIRDIDILSEEEKERILVEFNRTGSALTPYPVDSTIHAMFEDTARRVPDRTALVEGDNQLTYRALDETGDMRAKELSAKSVKEGDIVAVLMPRSIGLTAALLGILKAGAAYLPIDPAYPEERIRYMLADSNVKVMLSKSSTLSEKSEGSMESEVIGLNPGFENTLTPSGHLCYVIYTSGTTGRPRGVPIRHRGFINLVYYHREVFGEGPGSRMSQVANPGFDAMAIEVWPCLLSGAALDFAGEEMRPDPVKMKEWLIRRGITISFQSTVMAEQLLDEPWPESGVALNALFTGGDRLTRYPARPYPFKLYNLYGPTEDTVWATWTEVPVTPEAKGVPSIGKPVANHRITITGPNMEIQPVGVPGELCIAGAGLAPGYLNNPELTAEKFCRGAAPSLMSAGTPDPLTPLYKTGDLARWLSDGNIEFMGRIDNQVKLRGFRIETGEIEQCLLSHENVKEAVVVLKKDHRGPREYLCAYIVPAGPLPETTGLREYLAAALPAYMIPPFFVQLDKIPLTPNGKIDRGALPEPGPGIAGQYNPPRDEVEKELTGIWARVLGIEEEAVGIDANFFDLGGHSLGIVKVSTLINERFNKSIPVVTLFRLSTVRTQAAYIREEEISLQVTDEILEDSAATMDETMNLLMEDGDE